MAIQDVNYLFPKIKGGKIMERQEIVKIIRDRTGKQESDVIGGIADQRDAMETALCQGRPVRLEGIGIFRPVIKLDGTITIGFRVDPQLIDRLNASGAFTGTIINKANIGMTMQELEAYAVAHPKTPTE